MNNNYSDRGNDSSDESHSEDNNDVGNQNEAVDEDLTYEQYKSIIDLTANDVRGMEFGSDEHACKFYDSYARCHGFVARKDDIKRDAKDNIIMRQLVCNKEGLRNKKHFIRLDRKRPHRPITRTSCQAKLRVHFDYKRSKWTVLSFVETHNHYLCPPKYRHLIPAHRKMGDTDKAQAESLHSYGVRTCHIMGYMLAQKGDFKTAMYANFTPEKFENFWQQLILKHGLVENKWVSKTYENKYMWASAYLRDKFFGRIRTTSQCEAINSLVKSYANNKCSIIDFMHKFEQVVREYRNNELMADFKCFWSEPVLTTSLYKIERDASKIFTQEIFKDVKSEIEAAGALNVIERVINGEKLILKMNKYCDIGSEFVVDYDTVNCNFFCECKLFESRGIPCAHIICAMKNEHIDSIPSSLICKRWTKTAKSDIISASRLDDLDSDVMSGARVGAAAAACNRLCSIAREKNACFNDILNDIFKLLNKYENQGDPNNTVRSSFKDVGDPYLVKTKGAPSKKKYGRKRRCSNCSRPGHIARKCPRLLSTDDQVPMDGDSSHSDGDGFTIGEENDKEGNPVDQCDDQQIGSKNQSRMRKDNNVKGKGTGSFKMKEKTVNRSTHNSVKQPKIEPMVSSSDANADNPQHQNSNPVYATTRRS
ncbi:Zinc finger, CCHC-type [Sesbania bispinosa]|nr:Zinc finger, CCHC-type [Sesbania bispinosa]